MSHERDFKNVDEYISSFPEKIQAILQEMRRVVKETAPNAEETISYKMPTFKQNGILLYFAAFKTHISVFPTGEGVEAFKKELKGYNTSKGTIHFPFDKPIPYDLVRKIVRHRIEINAGKR